jgi:hypothetical protein
MQYLKDEEEIINQEKRKMSVKLEGGFELAKCSKCLRTVIPERLAEHEKNCQKKPYTPQKPPSVPPDFNMSETPLTANFGY